MNEQDRQAIQGLFARLAEVERNAPPRDADAEGFIREETARQPGAPYFMAQTIVMQDYALQQAQARIAELEQQKRELDEAQSGRPASGSGIFGGLFGSSQSPASRGSVPAVPRGGQQDSPYAAPQQASPAQPWGGPQGQGQGYGAQPGMAPGGIGGAMGRGGFGGGGFLAGAAQTAMGVAGGVLLGNAIGSLFGGGEAHAAAPEVIEEVVPQNDPPADDPNPGDDPGTSDGGGFFDDFFGGGGSDDI